MAGENQTFNSDFILLGIFDHSPTHTFLFTLVLAIFTVACVGNTAMVLLIYLDAQLHTPMYFLLSQLSLMDLMLICTTVPKMAVNFLSGRKSISLAGCATQIFFYVSLLGAECFLLAVMAYDRYIAICHPLRYTNLMSPKICRLMTAFSWILGSSDGIIDVVATFSFSYCGSREIAHFFCDFPSLLIHSCNDTSTFEEILFICCIVMIAFPVAIIIASYTRVILAIIHMGSGEGRRKAFATCSSHLAVVVIYYGTVMFMYIRPTSGRSPTWDKMVSAFYTILTPMLNPLIYSLRNREVSRAFRKMLSTCFHVVQICRTNTLPSRGHQDNPWGGGFEGQLEGERGQGGSKVGIPARAQMCGKQQRHSQGTSACASKEGVALCPQSGDAALCAGEAFDVWDTVMGRACGLSGCFRVSFIRHRRRRLSRKRGREGRRFPEAKDPEFRRDSAPRRSPVSMISNLSRMAWRNQTFSSDFILLGIFDHSPVHTFLFMLVLAIFTVACMGNTAMVLLIYLDTQLHTPMYFLLSQLSLMDLMLICTTVPKMAVNFLSGRKSISLAGCATQIFFYVSLLGAECFLLAAMAYDRYAAICQPLRYPVLMSQKLCVLLTASSWVLGSLDGIIVLTVALSFSYCDSLEIQHFFCDVAALLPLSCTDTSTFERLLFICCVVMLIFPVAVIITSYSCVLRAVVHMGSGESRRKAFATCSSHLLVVGLYYGAAMFMYMRPASKHTPQQDKMVSAFYAILTPMLNPLIYSLRNRDVSRGLMKLLGKGKLM
ncbi:uncharacterized protein O8D03_018873 [Erethizon dorsatum]